jgi:hypothetical protein
VWERPLHKADFAALGDEAPDGDILGARVPDEGVKFALIADEPDVYFTTPHFGGSLTVYAGRKPILFVRPAERAACWSVGAVLLLNVLLDDGQGAPAQEAAR